MSHYHDHCPICGVQWAEHGPACFKSALGNYRQGDTPYKCVICHGRGAVSPPAGYASTTAEETCNACKGAGVLWR